MINIMKITLLGIFRDRVLHGILILSLLFFLIPAAATLSMRQVTELSITLSLSLISFIQLLLSVFLGATSIWRDLERRYTYSVLSLPINRNSYILGRFAGIALFIVICSSLLCIMASMSVSAAEIMYPPDRRVVWGYFFLAILFSTLKYILIVGVAMLLSSVSTSFFLPIFGTICIFIASSITQQVYDYINSQSAQQAVSPLLKSLVSVLYYILPNLSGFDMKANAIYAITPSILGIGLTTGYFLVYSAFLLVGAMFIFSRREMK